MPCMDARLQTHRDAITALGGPSNLARELGIYRPVPATVHWPTRGIPARYWHRVAELLKARGHCVTANDIERLTSSKAAEEAI